MIPSILSYPFRSSWKNRANNVGDRDEEEEEEGGGGAKSISTESRIHGGARGRRQPRPVFGAASSFQNFKISISKKKNLPKIPLIDRKPPPPPPPPPGRGAEKCGELGEGEVAFKSAQTHSVGRHRTDKTIISCCSAAGLTERLSRA